MSVFSQIHDLLQPPDVETSNRRALELLNRDSSRDVNLSSLEATSSKAQSDCEALQKSLAASQAQIDALVAQTRAQANTHMHTAQELSLLRHSLADELSSLVEELVSSMSGNNGRPTLLEDIETMHRNLKEQESVRTYVQVIHKGLVLSEAAVGQVRATQPIDTSQYQALRTYVGAVGNTCSTVSEVVGQPDATLRLVDFLNDIRVKTWLDMKAALTSDLVAAAETLQWPKPIDWSIVSEPDRATFVKAFRRLLEFQTIGQKIHLADEKIDANGALYAIQALVLPVAQRFKYHFEGTRQTNKLDKPEWYFTNILNVSHEHRSFLEQIIQVLLAPSPFKEIDAWREFTINLLPLLSRRIKRTMPLLLPHPPLLAHTIYQALAFDSSLREEGFGVVGTMAGKSADAEAEWEGISAVILDRKEWFEQWMEGEKTFALEQYNDIISSQEAWTIADGENADGSSSAHDSDLRPTVSARRLKALVEQITDRYSPLPQFTQRTRFLIHVQLPLLESYHARVSASLDAFETLASALVRAVPGALGDRGRNAHLTSGAEGATRLCKALVSAKWMSAAMEAWGEDLFFVELWTEINHKASLRVRAETNPLLPDPKTDGAEIPEGTIFEELVLQYDKLVTRAEDMLVQLICGEVEGHLKPYFVSQLSDDPLSELSMTDMAVSPPLLTALASFAGHLGAIRQALPPVTTRAIYRRAASQLSSHIFQRLLFYRRAHSVTLATGRRLSNECTLWLETTRQALRGALRVDGPWARLLQGARLIGLDGTEWERVLEASFGMGSDEEWEGIVEEVLGGTELSREEVCALAKTREDCYR
ncbi:TIP-1 family-domain-containing protein [Vararia minispora EC-137]|uniref:TIP-1 family-domain-containing protein n=1 Tax=Vararia minispora EC-137 TaxID=1314806 RepID=A0ACB8QLI9_9AGAM|nr:TIP-1 family-domain-containing protein [Vararia minispora EC-137]